METPTPYGFDLDPGEQIDRIIHRHVITLVPALLGSAGLIIAALLLAYADGRFPGSIPFPRLMVMALVAILLILGAFVFLIGIFVFNRNVLIFTNIHLVQAEQYGLFNHRVSQVAFTRIQDVTGSKVGIAQSLFNYGNVEIQSAGETEQFVFRGAPGPQRIADDALEIHERCLKATGLPEPD